MRSLLLVVSFALLTLDLECKTFNSLPSVNDQNYENRDQDWLWRVLNAKNDGTSTVETTTESEATCVTNGNESGVCVPYYLCDGNTDTVIRDGRHLIDKRSTECPNYVDVCCKK